MAELPFSIQKIATRRPDPVHGGELGILMFSGLVLFLIAALILGGVFLYKQFLNGQIESLSSSLKRLEADFDPPLIKQLSETSKRIEAAKSLLLGHLSPSRVFGFLEENTLDTITFSNLSLTSKDASAMLNGEAKSYTALAQELAVLERNSLVQGVALSRPTLGPTGDVAFMISINFNPGIFSFR